MIKKNFIKNYLWRNRNMAWDKWHDHILRTWCPECLSCLHGVMQPQQCPLSATGIYMSLELGYPYPWGYRSQANLQNPGFIHTCGLPRTLNPSQLEADPLRGLLIILQHWYDPREMQIHASCLHPHWHLGQEFRTLRLLSPQLLKCWYVAIQIHWK